MSYGLIGSSLKHSRSPEIHKFLWNCDYKLWELSPEDLPLFFRKKEFSGINVTIPYKKEVLRFCDSLSENAQRIGAVNTIVKRSDGSLFGENTDLIGFQKMCSHKNISFYEKKVLILGTGGASSTVRVAAELGNCSEVLTIGRKTLVNYDNLYQFHADASVIINTTPVGMFPENGKSPIDLSRFFSPKIVIDLIYHPLRTQLLLDSGSLNVKFCNGLGMLVEQAAAAIPIFGGKILRNPEECIENINRNMENIVLIGMPGSGKSCLGKQLASSMRRSFVDLDAEIEKKTGRRCAEIIKNDGEAIFREHEMEITRKFGARTGLVIATGGGTILLPENIHSLRQNGKLIWIQREISSLERTRRPLSLDLEKIHKKREPLYRLSADFIVQNNKNMQELVEKVLRICER